MFGKKMYGISQNPDTNNYILVQKNFTWISGNEKIDDFIQAMQLVSTQNTVYEWIPYNQFNEIKEIGKGGFATIYSAMWKNGPLYLESQYLESYYGKFRRDPNK